MSRNSWAVVIPSMGSEFHRIDSLEMLYNQDTIIAYGLDQDKSWILYVILQEKGIADVLAMTLEEISELVSEIRNLSWIEAQNMVSKLKAEGYN